MLNTLTSIEMVSDCTEMLLCGVFHETCVNVSFSFAYIFRVKTRASNLVDNIFAGNIRNRIFARSKIRNLLVL